MFPAFDSLNAALAAMDQVRAGLPSWVVYWMTWMSFVFASSFWFAFKHTPARWVLLVALITRPASTGIVYLLGTGAWGLSHILLWTPLMIYIWRRQYRSRFRDAYGVWLEILILTIVVSLVFDFYEVGLWIAGLF